MTREISAKACRAASSSKMWDFPAIAGAVLCAAAMRARSLASREPLSQGLPLLFVPDLQNVRLRRGRFSGPGTLRKHVHLALYLTHVVFGISQRAAGACFARERTTVRYACARMEDARDDRRLDRALDALSAALAAHAAAFSAPSKGVIDE